MPGSPGRCLPWRRDVSSGSGPWNAGPRTAPGGAGLRSQGAGQPTQDLPAGPGTDQVHHPNNKILPMTFTTSLVYYLAPL